MGRSNDHNFQSHKGGNPHALPSPFQCPIAVTVNASGVAVGAVLEQLVEGSWQPLLFLDLPRGSIALSTTNFSPFTCQCNISISSWKAATSQLPWIISPLRSPSPRFQTTVASPYGNIYSPPASSIAGKSNAVADALSRVSINAVHQLEPCQGWISLPRPQLNNVTRKLQHTYRRAISELVLQDVQFGPTGNTLICDISTGHPRPRRAVLTLSMVPIHMTQRLLTDRYVWHGIRKQVDN